MSTTLEYVICVNLLIQDKGLQPFYIANYKFDPELAKDDRIIISFELLEFQVFYLFPNTPETREVKRQFTCEAKVEKVTKYLMREEVRVLIHISIIENDEALNELTLSYEPDRYNKMAKVPKWLNK